MAPLAPGAAGLTAGEEGLGSAGIAVGIAGHAEVLPAVLGPRALDLQLQDVAGGGDAEPLARGCLRPAGRQQDAVAVKGHGGRGVAVHGAVDDDQPAALRLLEERDGGGPGGVCGKGEDAAAREVPAVRPLPATCTGGTSTPDPHSCSSELLSPLRKRVIFTQ